MVSKIEDRELTIGFSNVKVITDFDKRVLFWLGVGDADTKARLEWV